MDILKESNGGKVTSKLYHSVKLSIPEAGNEDLKVFKVIRDLDGGLEFGKLTFFRSDKEGRKLKPDEITGTHLKNFNFNLRDQDVIAVKCIHEVRKHSYIAFYIFDGEDEQFNFQEEDPKVFSLSDDVY